MSPRSSQQGWFLLSFSPRLVDGCHVLSPCSYGLPSSVFILICSYTDTDLTGLGSGCTRIISVKALSPNTVTFGGTGGLTLQRMSLGQNTIQPITTGHRSLVLKLFLFGVLKALIHYLPVFSFAIWRLQSHTDFRSFVCDMIYLDALGSSLFLQCFEISQ